MWKRTVLGAGLSCVVLMSAGCSNSTDDDSFSQDTPTPTPANSRPTVSSVVLEDARNGETLLIKFKADDPDSDALTVKVQYSLDGGNAFSLCTAYEGSNPVSIDAGSLGQSVSLEWDFTEDVTTSACTPDDDGKCTVVLRLAANDGLVEGEGVILDPILLTATVVDDETGTGGTQDSSSSLDEVGGTLDVEVDNDGEAGIELKNVDSNRTEEFLLIVANTSDNSNGYTLDREAEGGSGSRSAAKSSGSASTSKSSKPVTYFREGVRDLAQMQWVYDRPIGDGEAERSSVTDSAEPVVGQTREEFKVIANLDDDGSYVTTLGILGAIGEGVLIFVDEDVPIGIDTDCTDEIPPAPDRQGRTTFGFDTCDLQGVADVFDDNILPHLHSYFGDESDVDGNEKLTVLITPLLNTITLTTSESSGEEGEEDEEEIETVLLYVDPEVDLTELDPDSNPGSNYQEIIYLAAPDPAGYFNPQTGGGGSSAIEEYVSVKMAANMAIATQELISYNAHVITGKGEVEEDWLKDGLGYLAADLTGFGSVVYDDVAYYLDAPYLYSLKAEDSPDSQNVRGVQYLFCRYLVDRYSDDDQWKEILNLLMTSGSTGTDNVEAALQSIDEELTFDEVWLDFLAAISLDGLTDTEGGDSLLGEVPGFNSANTIALDDTEYYGAQGYQIGLNIRDYNYVRRRTSDGDVVSDQVILLHGADRQSYAPGTNYSAYLTGGYAGQFTRIGGLIDAESNLTLTAAGDGLIGRIVRINDIDETKPTFVVEQVFGSLATDLIQMEIFDDGTESIALGEVDESQYLKLASSTTLEVKDTDLYTFDLTDSSWPSMVSVVIEADRSFSDTSGTASLDNVLFAVIPLGDLPLAGSVSGTYVCDGTSYNIYYPSSYLEYLYYQYVLTPTAGSVEGYSPLGSPSLDPTSCNFDYDREVDEGSILQNDGDEPQPTTLVDQILTYQVQSLGGASSVDGFFPYNEDFLDIESVDTDDTAAYDLEAGLGGRNIEEGEEAWMQIDLPAGTPEARYVIVVGGEDAIGPYELRLRVIDN